MNKEKFYVSNGEQYWEFKTINEIFCHKSPVQPISIKNIGHNFNDTYIDGEYGYPDTKRIKVDYVVYDYLWRVVRKEIIAEALEQPRKDFNFRRWNWGRVLENYLGFRAGPVPHTGRSKYNFYAYYRSISTTQERRWNCAHKKYTRGSRRNLRSAWDDIRRSDRDIKHSWKKQKKRKQWM